MNTRFFSVDYEKILNASPHCEMLCDRHGEVLLCTDAAVHVFACASTELQGHNLYAILEKEACETFFHLLNTHYLPGETKNQTLRISTAAGPAEVLCACRKVLLENEEFLRISWACLDEIGDSCTDASDNIDKLTDLPNKKQCLRVLRELTKKVRLNPDLEFAVIYIDIDKLKKINDVYGHSKGDDVIRQVADRLRAGLKSEFVARLAPDIFFSRLSGDEFFIILQNIPGREAVAVAKHLHELFEHPFVICDQDIGISISQGIVLSPVVLEHSDDLLRNANIAARRAKSTRHRYKVFTAQLLASVIKAAELDVSMPQALANKEFILEYQPICSLETLKLQGMEALVRWNHPKWGKIPPDEFIPIAEENGFIIPLGGWILEKACQDMRGLLDSKPHFHHLTMSVNLSGRQLNQFDICNQIKAVLNAVGLPPHNLKIEITESVAMSNPKATAAKLNELKQLGIQICLDDFGTGYSSLSYLQSFPIDGIKVDRSFVCMMDKNSKKRKIVNSVINLAHNLKLNVVAEGIELNDQWAMLKALDCEHGQGFLLSRPTTLKAILDLFDKPQP